MDADQVCDVFFTEEAYESFSIRPKFDINLFKAYNPSIETCMTSPSVKKSKESNAGKTVASERAAEIGSPTQSTKRAASNVANQKQPNTVWTLRSPKPQFPYPRYSYLTHVQQQRYLKLWNKHGFCHSNQGRYSMSADDVTQKQELRKLQISVYKEQQEFMKYAERVARCCCCDYETLTPQAVQHAKELWECQAQRVKNLPQYFSVCQTIGIAPAAVFPSDPILTSVTNLLDLGQPCVVDESLLSNKGNHNLIGAYIKKEQLKGRQLRSKTQEFEELGRDENAMKLAAKYRAHIVMASEALATLADNHAPGYNKSWQIPVHVKTNSTDTSLKTVYISKPLHDRYYHHDASRAFYLSALRDLLMHDDMQASTDSFIRDSPTDIAFGYNSSQDDLTKLETFGTFLGKAAKKNSKENCPGFESQAERKLARKDEKDLENLPGDTAVHLSDDFNAVQNEPLKETSADGDHTSETNCQDSSDMVWCNATRMELLSEEQPTPDINPVAQLHTGNSLATNKMCLTSPSQESFAHKDTVQQSQTRQCPELMSNGSETEGELVIAVSSSDADSPNRTNLKMESRESQRVIDKQLNDTNLMYEGNVEDKMLDDFHTPRRSRRLQKTDEFHQSSSPSTIKTSSSGVDEKAQTIIPDSPLSPPPHEKGFHVGAPVISQVALKTSAPASVLPESESADKTSRAPSSQRDGSACGSVSPQIKKPKLDDCGTADLPSYDEQGHYSRYNLRSKSGGNDPNRTLASEVRMASLDTSCSSRGGLDNPIPPSSIPDSCPKVDMESNDSSLNPANKKQAIKRNQGQNQPGLVSTIDSILKLQERLHSGKTTSNQPPVQPLDIAFSDGDGCVENASDYTMPLWGSVGYRLWKFGKYFVIVKGDIDAVSKRADGQNLSKMQVVNVVPKLEFQPHFGHEQISLSELTYLWIRLLLYPGSKVIQGRVNVVTSDLMMLEHFDMNSAIWEQPPFQPSRCMKMMFQILDKLTSLSEGTYLLRHSAGDMHACILQNVTPKGKTRSLYDLHQSYTQVHMLQSCPPQLLPWLPLDTNLMLPSHVAMGRIPATFPPKNAARKSKGPKTKGIAGQKTKKKKKKGKK